VAARKLEALTSKCLATHRWVVCTLVVGISRRSLAVSRPPERRGLVNCVQCVRLSVLIALSVEARLLSRERTYGFKVARACGSRSRSSYRSRGPSCLVGSQKVTPSSRQVATFVDSGDKMCSARLTKSPRFIHLNNYTAFSTDHPVVRTQPTVLSALDTLKSARGMHRAS
jgi:hypothetical protein